MDVITLALAKKYAVSADVSEVKKDIDDIQQQLATLPDQYETKGATEAILGEAKDYTDQELAKRAVKIYDF
jgi:hypothetical protein